MLAANPETSGVYYVDDHFVPYAGAKPVAKGLEQQAGPGGEGPRGHARDHGRRAGGVLRDRRAVGTVRHAAQGAGRAGQGRPARDAGSCSGSTAAAPTRPCSAHCREQQRALGDLPAGAAGRPGHAAGPDRHHRERQDPHDRLGRRDRAAQGLRRSPADHPVRARPGRPADPDIGLRCVPGRAAGLAEVPVAGGELPQVRRRQLRHRRDLRLRRGHRDEHQDRRQPGPQGSATPPSARPRRTWPPPNAASPSCSPTRRSRPRTRTPG